MADDEHGWDRPVDPRQRRGPAHRAPRRPAVRIAPVPRALLEDGERRGAGLITPALVILVGVLVVIGSGFAVSRYMRDDRARPPAAAAPSAPTETGPPSAGPPSAGPPPAATPPPPPSRPPRTTAPPRRERTTPPPERGRGTTAPERGTTAPDRGTVRVARAAVPGRVDLSAEGGLDWVHWGLQNADTLERDRTGNYRIRERTPSAPRARHALSPELFRWDDGTPVASSPGTGTGVRTCGRGTGFVLTVPATARPHAVRLYVGTFAARGRLDVALSSGARATARLETRAAQLGTAVFTVAYRAPRTGTLTLSWVTEESFDGTCGGVALQAASLR